MIDLPVADPGRPDTRSPVRLLLWVGRHQTRARRDTSLASVLTGRTVVAIAHRLHTANDADRVAVVEDGRLTELGTHDELVEHEGSYAALWESWHGGGPGRGD